MKALLAVFREEMGRIFFLRPVFAVLIVAAGIYALLYPQPYLNEALRRAPIVAVDKDGTTTSRELLRRVAASPDVSIAFLAPDLAAAEAAIWRREAHGILLIPADFERYLLHGRPSPIALYADASYFLIYQRINSGVSTAARDLGTQVEASRLVARGLDPGLALAAADPMPLTAVPLFNPQGGYATYVLPAAFVLILQQTLLIGVGLLGTLPGRQKRAGPVATVLGRLLAYLVFETLVLPFYLVALPYLYGLPRLGGAWPMLALALPFTLAVGGMGMMTATLLRRPLAVQLLLGSIGLPFFFLAGFAWPSEAIPELLRPLTFLVPSTAAIDGFVRALQLGAPLTELKRPLLTLWALALLYGGAAMILEALRPKVASGLAT